MPSLEGVGEQEGSVGACSSNSCCTAEVEVEPAERMCYICLDESCEHDDLIAPCECVGSLEWVHRGCLDRWRCSADNEDYFTQCRHCNFEFRLVQRSDGSPLRDARCLRRRRVVGQAARQFVFWVAVVQVVLCLLTLMIRSMDQKERLVKLFLLPQNNDMGMLGTFARAVQHHMTAYYLSTVVVLLALFAYIIFNVLVEGLYCLLGFCRYVCIAPALCCDVVDQIVWCIRLWCACAVLPIVLALLVLFCGSFFIFVVAMMAWPQHIMTRSIFRQELRQLTPEYEVQDLSQEPIHRRQRKQQ